MRFLKDWTVESPFTAFVSETSSYPTCWAWDPRLSYHDHFLKSFSINPYIEFFDELQNKITVVIVPGHSHTSCYGVAGIDPTYAFSTIPLKLELPTYFNVPGRISTSAATAARRDGHWDVLNHAQGDSSAGRPRDALRTMERLRGGAV